MEFKTFDDGLMNAIYLSELWAAHDLLRVKALLPEVWDQSREDQLSDEFRHAQMCRNALEQSSECITHDLQFAMQERLYKNFLSLQTQNVVEFNAVQRIMEQRAIWIFKSYISKGSNPLYKIVFKKILRDEANHQEIYRNLARGSFYKTLRAADFLIWKRLLYFDENISEAGEPFFDLKKSIPPRTKNQERLTSSSFVSLRFKSAHLWRWYYTDNQAYRDVKYQELGHA